jgi:proteasome accessory factor B
MARARTERMLNLLFVLLNSRVPLTREQIRERVPGYGESNEAFERMFERDKAALRDLAIPVETKPVDLFHDDVVGYRIDRQDWLMPEIVLSAQERTYLTLAASAWQSAQQRAAAAQAVRRISAQEQEDHPVIPISLAKGRKHIPELLEAIAAKHTVVFEYVGATDETAIRRNVDPWRALLHGGHWYLIGFDQDKGEIRTYRTDRIVGEVTVTKQQVLEPMPPNFDVASLVSHWDAVDHGKYLAKINLRPGRGASLRLLASETSIGDDWDTLTIPYFHESQIVGLIASSCDVARVLEPASLHEAVSRVVKTTLSVHNNGK